MQFKTEHSCCSARWHCPRLELHKQRPPVGNYPNGARCNQTADRDGRAAPFQSRQCHAAARPRRAACQRPTASFTSCPGSTEVSLDGETKMLNAGEGRYIANGKTAALTAGTGAPSTFLHFFLVSAADLGRPAETPPAAVNELYRTVQPIPDLSGQL